MTPDIHIFKKWSYKHSLQILIAKQSENKDDPTERTFHFHESSSWTWVKQAELQPKTPEGQSSKQNQDTSFPFTRYCSNNCYFLLPFGIKIPYLKLLIKIFGNFYSDHWNSEVYKCCVRGQQWTGTDLVHLKVEPKGRIESCKTSNTSNPSSQNENTSKTTFSTKKG